MSVGEIIDTLDILVKQGKTKAIGASNWTADRIAQANEYALKNNKTPFTVSQIQWSLLKMTPRDMNDDTLVCMNQEEYENYLKINVSVMAYVIAPVNPQSIINAIEDNGYSLFDLPAQINEDAK